jgi:Predicted Zn-dependent protease (DUF2268)
VPFQHRGTWDDLVHQYLLPNQAFLQSYTAFMSLGTMDWDQCLQEYWRQWWATLDAVQRLLTRMDGIDVEALAQQGYGATARLLKPTQDIPVYLFVGLAMSDSFQVMVEGQPTVGLAMEAYGWQFGAAYVGFEDVPHMLAHELCHAVRAQEADTAVTRFYRTEGGDIARALDHIPLYELVVDEGLSESTGRAVSPDLPLERILLYAPDDLRWCMEHEADLCDELARDWDRPVGHERFRRYFTGGTRNGGLPPRTGYFLGYRLVQRYLGEHPTVSLAQAVRMPAEAFIG